MKKSLAAEVKSYFLFIWFDLFFWCFVWNVFVMWSHKKKDKDLRSTRRGLNYIERRHYIILFVHEKKDDGENKFYIGLFWWEHPNSISLGYTIRVQKSIENGKKCDFLWKRAPFLIDLYFLLWNHLMALPM